MSKSPVSRTSAEDPAASPSELIPPEMVRKVADLARLALTDSEIARFSGQLSSVASHFGDLDALDTAGIAPATHALDIRNVFRPDVPGETLTSHELLAGAPAQEDGRFRVPRILDEE